MQAELVQRPPVPTTLKPFGSTTPTPSVPLVASFDELISVPIVRTWREQRANDSEFKPTDTWLVDDASLLVASRDRTKQEHLDDATRANPQFIPTGPTFDDALAAARELSRTTIGSWFGSSNIAQPVAVLQAADGKLALAPLQRSNGGLGPITANVPAGAAQTFGSHFEAIHPSVRAIVGPEVWIDSRPAAAAAAAAG